MNRLEIMPGEVQQRQYAGASLPMRILHVYAGARYGGAETFATDLIVALASAGVEQAVVTRPFRDRLQRLAASAVVVHPDAFGPTAMFATRGRIGRIIREFRPAVVHAWMGRAASVIPCNARVPVIGWFGGYYDIKRYKSCDFHVGVTKDLVRHIIAAGIPADRVQEINTFAALADEPPAERADHDTPNAVPLILCLARLHRNKGVDTLLRALAEIRDAYLWIAGEGELKRELIRQARSLGVAARVRFLGWRDDRGALLRAADICVLPSRSEPFGTVMVEAWAAGVPLVAAAAAGPAAYVSDGVDGLLFPVDDAAALADRIRACIARPALARALSAAGRHRYQSDFTREKIVSDYLALYDRLAQRGRSFQVSIGELDGIDDAVDRLRQQSSRIGLRDPWLRELAAIAMAYHERYSDSTACSDAWAVHRQLRPLIERRWPLGPSRVHVLSRAEIERSATGIFQTPQYAAFKRQAEFAYRALFAS
jgi:glycosyltransferase involved in cell wall biosynthesis